MKIKLFTLHSLRKLKSPVFRQLSCFRSHDVFSDIAGFETNFLSAAPSFPVPWLIRRVRRVSDTVGGKISSPDIEADAGWNGCDFAASVLGHFQSDTFLLHCLPSFPFCVFHLEKEIQKSFKTVLRWIQDEHEVIICIWDVVDLTNNTFVFVMRNLGCRNI